jgi:hypothetical protein
LEKPLRLSKPFWDMAKDGGQIKEALGAWRFLGLSLMSAAKRIAYAHPRLSIPELQPRGNETKFDVDYPLLLLYNRQ